QRPFALVYGHSFAPDFAAKVRDWADRRGLPLLSLGYRNDWADMQWLTADPHDYAHAFSRAEAVATNFFHGCVFALANEKPFAAGLTEYRSIKVRGLMELLDAERHVVASEGGVDELLDEPIEPRILSRIEELRQTSTAFLVRALEGSHAAHAA
ncbi:MAG TPA: polysaccharide pyruvyl transferase family protein, partial [Fimbriimonadaceae bacterium]|nr:polysaccharide pyruvyl transferase family protein [Fimbriimonadaceae bacterium]